MTDDAWVVELPLMPEDEHHLILVRKQTIIDIQKLVTDLMEEMFTFVLRRDED